MLKYPKIETIFERDQRSFKVILGKIRCEEFKNIKNWLITEKIDGTNIRVEYINNKSPELFFKGRTDKAQIPTFLFEKLQKMFKIEQFMEIFPDVAQVCLFGEGYGEKIQKGGGNYRKGVSFRLFDVWIDGWWLKWEDIKDIAKKLNIKTVPSLGIMPLEKAVEIINPHPKQYNYSVDLKSTVAYEENGENIPAEGIVATAYPLVLFRNGNPLKWKLKARDFKKEEVKGRR